MSVQTGWSGRTLSVVHKDLCFHFRRKYGKVVELSVIDRLDSDESIPGELAPRIPAAVKHELRAEGYEVRQ